MATVAPILAVTGNEAVAEAMRQINPDVVAAYPITPQTEIVQIFAQYVADGKVDTEFITVESEHSAMSAAIGSAAGGARTMTATSSQGLALMWELLHIASGYRLPIVMANVNRALSGPINIHCDHSDSMGSRDTGWIQLYGEAHQEAYDNHLMAVRIAEHPDVRTPVMTMTDGFIVSGAIGPLQELETEQVQEFIGPFKAINPMLDSAHPVTVGPFDGLHGWFFEHKSSQQQAMERALKVVDEVDREYAALSGRRYDLLDPYRMDDAEFAIVVVGSTAGATRMVVDKLRGRGRQGRHDPRAAVPALPVRRVRPGCSAAARWSACSTAPSRSAPRAGPCSSRCARPSTTATRDPRCCPSSTASAAATSSPTTSTKRSPRCARRPRPRRSTPDGAT